MSIPDIGVPWPVRIARRVAPDEVDLATDIAAAYAAGGVTRRDLFRPDVADPGSFDVGIALLLPHVLHALDSAYVLLRDVLRHSSVATNVSVAGLVLSYHQVMASRTATTPAATPGGTGYADPAVLAFAQVVGDLRRAGLSHDEAEWIVAGTFEEMARYPRSAAEFLDHLHRAGR